MNTEKVQVKTRDRLVAASVRLLKEKGPSGTGTAQILEAAEAPRGSLYFHFPEGKDELIRTAVTAAGDDTASMIRDVIGGDGAIESRFAHYFDLVADDLEKSGFQYGCAVGATTLDLAAIDPSARNTVTLVFDGWIAIVTTVLRDEGFSDADASMLSSAFVSTIEGATLLARATGTGEPLRAAGRLFSLSVATLAR